MCDHFLGFYTYQRIQAPRMLWRCGTCGRQSSVPIDCCAQPDFASTRRSLTVHLGQRLGKLWARAWSCVPTLRAGRQHPGVDISITPDSESLVPEPAAPEEAEAEVVQVG